MKTELILKEKEDVKDYYPALFSNKDNSIIILATERSTEKTFSGTVIHSANKSTSGVFGKYSEAWTYVQFSRLKEGSEIVLSIIQEKI